MPTRLEWKTGSRQGRFQSTESDVVPVTRADKGEVDEEQTLDAAHSTVLDEHDDDERVSGEREEEHGRVEAEERDRRRLADREHVGKVVLDQSGRRVRAEVERTRRHVRRPVRRRHRFRSD